MNSTYYTKQAVGKTKVPEKINDKEGSNSLRSVHSIMTFICKTTINTTRVLLISKMKHVFTIFS